MNRRGFLRGAASTAALGLASASRASADIGVPPLQVLTYDPRYNDNRPVFSPDGKTILFGRTPAVKDPTTSSLWTVPAAGGTPKVLFQSNSLQASRPDWSWDRTAYQIAFTGQTADGTFGLYLLDIATRKTLHIPVRIAGAKNLEYPSWYPGGQYLSVTDYETLTLYLVGLDGSARPFTNNQLVWTGQSSVSRNWGYGCPVAFAGQVPDGPRSNYNEDDNQIWLQYPGEFPFQLDGLQGRSAWWSPDGTKLAFASGRLFGNRTSQYRIFLEDGAGGPARAVTSAAYNVDHPKWSPDGHRMAFYLDFGNFATGISLIHL